MKIILINSDSMVAKLFEAVAKKLGLDLVCQEEFEISEPQDRLFLFVDDSINGNFSALIQACKPALSCYLHKRSASEIEGFDFYIKKPFLPTEILDIMTPKLAEFGITEKTTSNITKNDLEDLSDLGATKGLDLDSDLDDFDIESLENLDLPTPQAVDKKDSEPLSEPKKESLEEKYGLKDLEELTGPKLSKDVENKDVDFESNLKPSEKDNRDLIEEMEFDLDGLELDDDIAVTDKEKSPQEFNDDTLDELPLKTSEEDAQNVPDFSKEEEKQVENPDFEHIDDEIQEEQESQAQDTDIQNQSGILDKGQIDEVKKILEETSKKDVPMEETQNIENFENIDEKDIMNALNNEDVEGFTDGKDSQESHDIDTLEASDKDFAKELGLDEIDINQEEQETSQEGFPLDKNVQDLIKNAPLESLKSLLDGMQLTINISFPKNKK